jgi:transcriptional regulator with XRE-family HTH domain
MTDNRNGLGKMLRGRRLMMRLTLRELSALSRVSLSHLGRIERGERSPSAGILQKIAKPLGFEDSELFIHAGYLPPQASTTGSEIGAVAARVEPYIVRMLAQESVEVQRAILGILSIMKFLGRIAR